MAIVTLRYWAAAKSAAGAAEETIRAGTLAEALTAAGAGHREQLRQVLARCSFLVDGQPAGAGAAETVALADGAVVDVLPPFAGG